MIGHFVTGTVWRVTVSWENPDGEGTIVFERNIVTPTDDGSDVYEVARRRCFPDASHAASAGFTLLKVRKIGQVDGFALGEAERLAS